MKPYFRTIEYTDDGCSVYECLSCKVRWEARFMPTKFCGGCGIKFVGEFECKPRRDKSKWVQPDIVPASKWIIEVKQIWLEYLTGSGSIDWTPVLDCGSHGSKFVLDILKRYRAEERLKQDQALTDGYLLIHDLFRARIVSGITKVEYCSRVPYPSELKHIEMNRQYWMKEQKQDKENA